MTKEALKSAAAEHVRGLHFSTGMQVAIAYDAALGAFIAGAAWQAERPAKFCCNEFDAMRQDRDDFKSQVSDLQAKLDAMTGERDGWKNSATDFAEQLFQAGARIAALEKDASELAAIRTAAVKDRDDWHHAYDRLVSDVVHGRDLKSLVDPSGCRAFPDAATFAEAVENSMSSAMRETLTIPLSLTFRVDEPGDYRVTASGHHDMKVKRVIRRVPRIDPGAVIGVDPAAPGSDRTVIAVCRAYERDMEDGRPGHADNGEMPSAWYPGKWTADTFAPEKGAAEDGSLSAVHARVMEAFHKSLLDPGLYLSEYGRGHYDAWLFRK